MTRLTQLNYPTFPNKKGSQTHPTPLGIVLRRPPQFYTILCHTGPFYARVRRHFYKYFFNSFNFVLVSVYTIVLNIEAETFPLNSSQFFS